MNKIAVKVERKKSRRYRIAVAMILSGMPGQRKLAGVFSKLKEFDEWDISIFRTQEEIAAEFGKRKPSDFDGIIYSGFYNKAIFANFTKFSGPLVVMDNDSAELHRRNFPTVVIRNSAIAIADAAKRYYDDVGCFKSAAFINERKSTDWSKARCEALSSALDDVKVFASSGLDEKSDLKLLKRFLSSLDKPSMVLCANDARAREVLEVANRIDINIPSEISIIGVDNDPYVCCGVSPNISSIEPDHFREGEIAAEKLGLLLRGKMRKAECERIYVGVSSVILRGSSLKRQTSKNLVKRAREYIAQNSTDGLSPAEVAKGVGVSRPLLDLRLREAHAPTLSAMIAEAQLAAVAKMLTETSDSIEAISDRCGFSNHRSLKNRFKARYGMTMREYRNAHFKW